MREYQKLSLRKTQQNNRQHFLKGRMDSPPPYCCSSGTASSSLSQPISLEFGPPPISLQNLSSSKENWPKEEINNEGRFNSFIKTSKPPPNHFKYGGNPIKFDDLIYGSLNNFCWKNNENKKTKTSLMIFSSSEDLTTSDSEICKYSSINRGGRINEGINGGMINFGKFPSLSTIYPNNSSLSLDDSEQQKEMLTTRRHYNNEGGGGGLTLSDSETEMTTNYLIKNKKEFNGHNHLINKLKKQKTPQRIPALEMVEEISPVLPRPNLNDEDFDVPPLPRPLQSIGREWRPIQTSTLANLHSFLPRTNPRQQKKNEGGIVNNNLPQVIPLDPPRSLFDPFFPQQSSSSSTTISARPEQYNLPSALAKSFGIKGILFIQIAIVGNSLLIVHVRNGALFLENCPSSCYVKVEIRRSPSNRKRSKYDHRFRSKLSSEVRESNWPEFFDDFQFKISPINLQYGDKLGLSLYITTTPTNISSTSTSLPSAAPAAELLGRMSFSLRKFFRLAKQQQNDLINGRQQSIQICEGGFFLLPDRLGQQSHLSQNNILHKKYYDEIGVTGCSSISSNSSFGSPFKMMSEPEWAPSLVPNLGRTNFLKNTNFGKNQKIAATNNCSNSSSSQSGVDCKRRQMMADSSDFTSLTSSIDGGGVHNVEEDSFNGSGGNIENLNKNNNCSSSTSSSSCLPPKPSQKQQIYSSTSTSTTELPLNKKENKEELNKQHSQQPQQFIKRNSVTNSAPLTDKLQRKNQLGPLGRTFNFLKSKLDFSLSASVLCPSKEECRLWQEDFFTLLSHKYGCMLFREFLQSEFSEENLDFWLDVENFKQMKDSKKQTLQKAQQIYDTYIKELAPKEVNLDSETRMKTKNGLQSIPLKTDIFNLAQNKIEQLMSKDSYSRFLKSEQYLDLLDDIPNVGDKPRSASNGLLRVSSTKSNGSILNSKRSTASRSPSLSPKLGFGGGGRCVRRNTCSPTSPVTSLQIPCIRE